MGFVGFLLITSKFDEEQTDEEVNFINVLETNDVTLQTIKKNNSHIESNQIARIETPFCKKPEESFSKAVSSFKFWHTLAIGFFNVCNIKLNLVFLYTMTNLNKKFGVDNLCNETLLNTMVTLFSLVNGCSRLFIGSLMDFISFKKIFATLAFLNVKNVLK